jgi:monoterpene epsilon-lactone hydrolase
MPSDEAIRMRAALTQSEPAEHVSVEEGRRSWETAAAQTNAGLDCRVTPLDLFGIPGEEVDGSERADPERPVMLLLHGGGYTSGSPRTHRELAFRLASACGCSVILPDYRIAPEHPCPAAVEDAVVSYRWLLEQGFDPDRIVIAGDSAGGGLVAATLVALRDLDVPQPAAAVLLSPWVDLTLSGSSYDTRAASDPFITRSGLERAAAHYLAGRDPADPIASPLFADLRGLPPMLIHAGSHEILESDSILFADAAAQANVDVRLKVWDGLWHVFHFWAGDVPEAREALAEIGAYVRAVTRRSTQEVSAPAQ